MKSELTREDILQIIEEEKQKIKTAAAKPKKADKLPDDPEYIRGGLIVVKDGVEYAVKKTTAGDFVLTDAEEKKHTVSFKELQSDYRLG